MKQIILMMLLLSLFVMSPAKSNAITLPCSMVLNPINSELVNAKGTALIYPVQLLPSFPRTNISILGVHLPKPSAYGDYDSYEGFAMIPEVISWRFRLYPTPEIDGPTWAGRFDEITAAMDNVDVHIRLSNSKLDKLGPAILAGNTSACK